MDKIEVTANLMGMYRGTFLQNLYYRIFCVATGITKMPRDVHILDCACGTGSLLYVLKNYGFHNIEGFDAAPEMVDIARKKVGHHVICCDALDIETSFNGKKFDVIIVANFLHHLKDVVEWDMFLTGCAKLLNKGGQWINREPCTDTSIQKFFKRLSQNKKSLLWRIPSLKVRAESWILEGAQMDYFKNNWEPNCYNILAKKGFSVTQRFRLIDSTIIKAVFCG